MTSDRFERFQHPARALVRAMGGRLELDGDAEEDAAMMQQEP